MDLFIALIAVIVSITWFEVLKILFRSRHIDLLEE